MGAHPAELSRRIKAGMDIENAEQSMRNALQTAQIIGIRGEGSCYWRSWKATLSMYPMKNLKLITDLSSYAMELAKDADCPVQLHTESAGPEQFLEFAKMADKVGIPRNKIIKHFSGAFVLEEENHGLTPSLIATKDVVKDGLKKGKNFLMETDYLDDKTRPGAVLGPKTVPRRTHELINQGFIRVKMHTKSMLITLKNHLPWC